MQIKTYQDLIENINRYQQGSRAAVLFFHEEGYARQESEEIDCWLSISYYFDMRIITVEGFMESVPEQLRAFDPELLLISGSYAVLQMARRLRYCYNRSRRAAGQKEIPMIMYLQDESIRFLAKDLLWLRNREGNLVLLQQEPYQPEDVLIMPQSHEEKGKKQVKELLKKWEQVLFELLDREMPGRETPGRELSDREMSDREMSGRKTLGREQPDWETSDLEMSGRKTSVPKRSFLENGLCNRLCLERTLWDELAEPLWICYRIPVWIGFYAAFLWIYQQMVPQVQQFVDQRLEPEDGTDSATYLWKVMKHSADRAVQGIWVPIHDLEKLTDMALFGIGMLPDQEVLKKIMPEQSLLRQSIKAFYFSLCRKF